MRDTKTENHFSRETVRQLCDVLKTHVFEKREDPFRCEGSFSALCDLAQIHGLAPILYYTVKGNSEAAGHEREYAQLKRNYMISVACSVRQEMSLQEIREKFRAMNLPILFFKGAQIREFYPVPQLRTMGDMDALIAEKDREKAHEVMLESGYTCGQSGGDVWVYRKDTTVIEMHTKVAGNGISNQFDYAGFFADAMNHCAEEDGKLYFEKEYHFCFLIYHIAKHLSSTGAGIRMFLDIAVFLQHYGVEFNRDLAEKLLRKTKLEGTAAAVFGLCDRWFGTSFTRGTGLPENVLDELEDYVIHGGTFGFQTHDVGDIYRRRAHGSGNGMRYRLQMWRDYLFPAAEDMVRFLPALKEHRWMLPAAWVKRWWEGAFQRREKSIRTIRSMNRKDNDRSYREYVMLKKIGL